jgi:hypothetical protein
MLPCRAQTMSLRRPVAPCKKGTPAGGLSIGVPNTLSMRPAYVRGCIEGRGLEPPRMTQHGETSKAAVGS